MLGLLRFFCALACCLFVTLGGKQLCVALRHEFLDVGVQAIENGLNLVLLGAHLVELLSLLIFQRLKIALLILEFFFLRSEVVLNALDFADGRAVAIVHLVEVVHVRDELIKRRGGEQKGECVVASVLVAFAHASGKGALLLLELFLLFLDFCLGGIDIVLHRLDVAHGLVELLGKRLVFAGDCVELRLDLVVLCLGVVEGIGGFFGCRCSRGGTGDAIEHGGGNGTESELERLAACHTVRDI